MQNSSKIKGLLLAAAIVLAGAGCSGAGSVDVKEPAPKRIPPATTNGSAGGSIQTGAPVTDEEYDLTDTSQGN